jgi:hypothetical protein
MSNLERVLEKFAANDAPYFMVVDGRFTCIGKNVKHSDITEATARLKSFLEELDTDSKSVFKIYCFEKLPTGKLAEEVKKIITKGDHDYLLTFSAYSPKEISADVTEQRAIWKFERLQKEQELQAQLQEIKALLLKKDIEESAEDEEEIVNQMQPNNIVGNLFNSPEIQQVLAAGIAGLVAKFLVPAGVPQAVAGVPDVPQHTDTETDEIERIGAAIEILRSKDKELCKHLEKLAEMAQKETTKFNFLLTML